MPEISRRYVKRSSACPPRSLRASSGATVIDNIIVLVLVAVLLLVIMQGYLSKTRGLRETALTIELSTLRTTVNLYATLKGKLPDSLKELSSKNVVQPKRDIKGSEYDVVIVGGFVESMSMDEQGYITDPFGNRYIYDPSTGRVGSSSEGYLNW